MSTNTAQFPRRDENGRIELLPEMVGFTVLTLLVGFALLAAIDAVVALVSSSDYGQINGWMSGLLAAFIFIDDFRANRGSRIRWIVMPAAAVLGAVAGLGLVTMLPESWAPLVTGGLAVGLAGLIYATLWFTGVRIFSTDSADEASKS